MNRRDAIKRTSFLLGSTLSASAILGVMSGCKADPTLTWAPEFFTIEEGSIVETIAERIIPKTDTPGATEAGVPGFIDQMMSNYYPEEDKLAFQAGLKQVDADAQSEHGQKFVALQEAEQVALLEKYDQAAFGDSGDSSHFFRKMKELTVLGFCTSEPGATEFLEYDVVPGEYKGCIPYSDVGKAWAT